MLTALPNTSAMLFVQRLSFSHLCVGYAVSECSEITFVPSPFSSATPIITRAHYTARYLRKFKIAFLRNNPKSILCKIELGMADWEPISECFLQSVLNSSCRHPGKKRYSFAPEGIPPEERDRAFAFYWVRTSWVDFGGTWPNFGADRLRHR